MPRKPYSNQPGLLGLFVHVYKDGKIQEQGRIERADGSFGYVQLYSWVSGGPTHIKVYNRKFLRSDNCKLYLTEGDWKHAAEMEARKHGGA